MISVIVALYNEAERFPVRLPILLECLESLKEPFELVLVDDGSTDRTFELIRRMERDDKRVRALRLEHNLGQGAAIKLGALATRGDVVLYVDADLAVPLRYLPELVRAVRSDCDIAVASRWMQGAEIRSRQPGARRVFGRFYYALVRAILLPGVQDTNCGMKAFRGETARLLFGFVRCWRWAFNAELLWLASRAGYRIREVPVEWSHVEGSRVRVFRDIVFTFWELFGIKVRQAFGIYPEFRPH